MSAAVNSETAVRGWGIVSTTAQRRVSVVEDGIAD